MRLLLCALAVIGLSEARTSIYPTNGINRGEWGWDETCYKGATNAFEFKYEETNHLDNTAGNAIRMYCESGEYVTSTEGDYGRWQGIRSCPAGHFLMGYKQRVLSYQGTFGDDWGVDNVMFRCTDGTELEGLPPPDPEGKSVDTKDSYHGDWGEWVECPAGQHIMGIRTQVEQGHAFDDDAGLCDVVLFCNDHALPTPTPSASPSTRRPASP